MQSLLHQSLSPSSRQPLPHATEFDATTILNELRNVDNRGLSGSLQVERLVASLLSQAGAELVENPERGRPDSQIDLAFLPARGAAEVILVEVKAGRLTEELLNAAETQLQRYVLERQASLGLLLYHDFDERNLPSAHTTPMVIRMSVRQLAGVLPPIACRSLSAVSSTMRSGKCDERLFPGQGPVTCRAMQGYEFDDDCTRPGFRRTFLLPPTRNTRNLRPDRYGQSFPE